MASGSAPQRWRSAAGWIVRLGVAAAILAYLFSFIPLTDVLEAVSSASPGWIAVTLGLVAVERLLGAYRVTILSRQAGMPLSVLQNLRISVTATFYGMFLPGELAGGAVRWYKMSRPSGMRAEAAASLSFDRLIDTIVLVLAGLVFWLLEGPSVANAAIETGLLALLVGLLALLCLSLSRTATSLILSPLASFAYRLRLGIVYRSLEKIMAAVHGFRALSRRSIMLIVAVSVVRQALAIGIVLGFATALHMGVGFVTLGWIRTFMNIVVMLPVSVSGLGVREGTLVFLLQPYGVAGSTAIALSLLLLLSHVLVAAAGGLLEVKNLSFRPRNRAATRPEGIGHEANDLPHADPSLGRST